MRGRRSRSRDCEQRAGERRFVLTGHRSFLSLKLGAGPPGCLLSTAAVHGDNRSEEPVWTEPPGQRLLPASAELCGGERFLPPPQFNALCCVKARVGTRAVGPVGGRAGVSVSRTPAAANES